MYVAPALTLALILSIQVLPSPGSAQVKIPASPYGGQRMLKEFIKEEMVYPEHALANNVEGTVKLLVSVDEEGEAEKITLYGPADPELDKEALRIMDKVLWEPAQYHGFSIPDEAYIEIGFTIKKYQRICKERGYDHWDYPCKSVDTSNKVYQPGEVDSIPRLIFSEKGMTLSKFITQHIEYPEEALRNSLSGSETVHFVVEPSGRISNMKPEKHLGAGCCEETVRLVKLLKWYPGIRKNMAVRVMMNITITFNLNQDGQYQYVPTFLNNSMQ